ncbi:hypothetical protein ACTXT7_003632 [Hymenolepis weldensis]
MECLDNLSKFFEEFDKATNNLKILIPSLNESITETLKSVLEPPHIKSDDEIYAGLPTIVNSRPLFNVLALCTPKVGAMSLDKNSKGSHRQILTRLELIALLASIYEQNTTELSVWQALEALSHQTKRVIDEVYGLMNRAYLKLKIAEQTCYSNREHLMYKVGRIKSALRSKSALFTDFENVVSSSKMPTAHASLQCFVSDCISVYIQNYDDWYATRSRLEMVMIRHRDFLDNKSWAAVYCRAFINWLMLRARLNSGASPKPLEDDSETPISLLYAATNVKLHARTLVKFTMNHLNQKYGKDSNNKENNSPNQSFLAKTEAPVPEMVNLWLGTRLLLEGSLQVAELYTLLGSIKEARFYQLELLRIAQRFHIPSCAQSALCMMAYTDLLSQRVWAFDLRLTQLSYILNSPVLLDDIIKSREKRLRAKSYRHPAGEDEEEESNFLKSSKQKRQSPPSDDCCSDEDEPRNADLMQESPIKGSAVMNSPDGFPSLESIAHVIAGNKEPKAIEEEGAYNAFFCAHRILNGCIWVWMNEIVNFVRMSLTTRDHYLPALIPPRVSSEEEKDLSTALESKCAISPAKNFATPAPPLTKAARAALVAKSARKPFRVEGDEEERILELKSAQVKSLCPPQAPRRLIGPWMDGDIASLPRRSGRSTRNSKISSAELSTPEDSRQRDYSEKGDEVLSTHQLSVFKGALRGKKKPPVNSLFGHYGPGKSGFVFGTETQTTLRIFQDLNSQKETSKSEPEFKRPDGIKPLHRIRKMVSEENGDVVKSLKDSQDEDIIEPIESCPVLAYREPLPTNMRLTNKYLLRGLQPKMPTNVADGPSLENPPESLITSQDAFAERLYATYATLAALPVPHLMRPVCQWLGLRLLGRGDQSQAARYFAQAIGNAACGLFTSMLSSKIKIEDVAQSLRTTYAVSAPYDSSEYLTANWKSLPPTNVVQLMLVDELGQLNSFEGCDEKGSQPANDLVAGGLGARKQLYLIATRWFLGEKNACIESRVIHKFSAVGLQYMRDFEDLQSQNNSSMLESDRRQFWAQRFSLDTRLKNLIDGVRNDCFTAEELEWLKRKADSQNSIHDRPTVLILDRQLTLLPWEWIIWGQWDDCNPKCCVPTVCRNFSLTLLVGHQSLKKSNVAKFNSDSAFYVVNPEANLPSTEETFQSYFTQHFPKWSGIYGRMPQPKEVVEGFVQKDLFVYLGHGNGSKCLMPTFDEGVNSKAVAFIIGCSSGRPRIEGRHEAYASVFNHLISGAPTAVTLMWDVTDKDIDRFTQSFLDNWIRSKESEEDENGDKENDEEDSSRLTMTWKIFKSTKVCKLQSLVGKSVIVYGLPAIPAASRGH